MITEKDFGFKKEIRTITHPKTGEPHTVYLREGDITLNTKIYRYIDFTYLLDMLKNKKLYVANRASFSDRRDSKGEKASLEEIGNELDVVSKQTKKSRREQDIKQKDIRKQCISCWTLNTNEEGKFKENYLLWKSHDNKKLVCRISTTIGKMIDSLESISSDVIISKVSYHDPLHLHIHHIYYDYEVFGKTSFYSEEREVRFLFITNNNESYFYLDINTENFLSEITLSPFINPTLRNFLSEQLISQYPFLKDKISKSNIIEY